MTVWVFGDSFANIWEEVNDNWTKALSEDLNTDLRNFACSGAAIEFAYQRFNIARKKIEENDTVIITLTDLSNRWFFKHNPEMAIFRDSPTNDKHEKKAISLYYQYLQHKEIQETYLTDFLYNLCDLMEKKNINVILLPVHDDVENYFNQKRHLFPQLHIAVGKLFDVSYKEFVSEVVENYIKELISCKGSLPLENENVNLLRDDNRLNHLCKSNHVILKNKILDAINNKTTIDLTQGFLTDIITSKDMLKDENFKNIELYGVKIKAL